MFFPPPTPPPLTQPFSVHCLCFMEQSLFNLNTQLSLHDTIRRWTQAPSGDLFFRFYSNFVPHCAARLTK